MDATTKGNALWQLPTGYLYVGVASRNACMIINGADVKHERHSTQPLKLSSKFMEFTIFKTAHATCVHLLSNLTFTCFRLNCVYIPTVYQRNHGSSKPPYLKDGLYLYTLIIGHKSSNLLSILNKLPLQKELQIFVTNNVVLDKK